MSYVRSERIKEIDPYMRESVTDLPVRSTHARTRRHLCLFVRSFGGSGGAERVMLNLARELAKRGHRIDLVMGRKEGHYIDEIPDAVNVVGLEVRSARQALPALLHVPRDALRLARMIFTPGAHWTFGAIPGLARYLRREHPDALLAALDFPNVVALVARRLSSVNTRVVISAHGTLSMEVACAPKLKLRTKALPSVVRHFYPQADAIVAVSKGVAKDLAHLTRLRLQRITTIYNPVVTSEIPTRAEDPGNHPWFTPASPPVFLGVGGLKPAKDFRTLLRAFARVRAVRNARLMILGEGKKRAKLEKFARQLGIAHDVIFPGFVENPYAYMARAAVFVLSSAWEGLPTVLIEAMACGCPVVSTDCPSGPAEILDGGKYGPLVPVGDDAALAKAILSVLNALPDRERLRARAAEFSVERAADQYLEVLLGTPQED